jgi:hypothetical protein
MLHKFSLHKIDNEKSFTFKPYEYSRFKYGDDLVAEKFGEDLASAFIVEILQSYNLEKIQMVVISSPYSFIPTATFAMKNYFVKFLNRWLVQQKYLPVQESKIHREVTYKEDYGNLTKEERITLIKNDKFQIEKAFLENKLIIFLDDIRITGSHEKMIQTTLEKFKIENDYCLLYFAELINDNISPKIENYFNNYCVKSLNDLLKIINSERFVFNTRFIKFILNANENECKSFLLIQDTNFLNKFYDLSIGNNYHSIEAYKNNFEYLEKLIYQKVNKKIQYGN